MPVTHPASPVIMIMTFVTEITLIQSTCENQVCLTGVTVRHIPFLRSAYIFSNFTNLWQPVTFLKVLLTNTLILLLKHSFCFYLLICIPIFTEDYLPLVHLSMLVCVLLCGTAFLYWKLPATTAFLFCWLVQPQGILYDFFVKNITARHKIAFPQLLATYKATW